MAIISSFAGLVVMPVGKRFSERIGIMPKLKVCDDYLIIGERFGQDTEILLNLKSKKLLERLLLINNKT